VRFFLTFVLHFNNTSHCLQPIYSL